MARDQLKNHDAPIVNSNAAKLLSWSVSFFERAVQMRQPLRHRAAWPPGVRLAEGRKRAGERQWQKEAPAPPRTAREAGGRRFLARGLMGRWKLFCLSTAKGKSPPSLGGNHLPLHGPQ
jgi:hypothetical protein